LETTCLHMMAPSGIIVPPSGGSLEIGNDLSTEAGASPPLVPPSGGSLEIGNCELPPDWLEN